MEGVVRRKPPEEGESYFMSMTDMMVGLLLIFIILLAYFALNLQTKTEELTGANRTRAEILNALQPSLKDRGDRKSVVSGTSVTVGVDLGGRRVLNITQNTTLTQNYDYHS